MDCRFTLGDPGAGRRAYERGHIRGAAFLDLDTDLSGAVGNGRDGRHPLPTAEQFQAAARRAGIDEQSVVIAYDARRGGGAARLWWLLRHFGHEAVAVLDGGFAGWDGPVESGDTSPAPGGFTARERSGDTVALEDVEAGLGSAGRVLVDARAPERFRGEVEPIDAVPGHIPGARNLPFTQALPADVAARLSDREVVVYCGSGVTACVVLLDLAAHGHDGAKLYPGSYSQWAARGMPVERG